MINKKFGLTLAAVSSLFSGVVMADPYAPSSIGALQPTAAAGFSASVFTFSEAITFTLTGEGAFGASLAAVPVDTGSVANARSAQASGGVLPDGTYTFVDESGAEARVRVEDGELIPLH